LIIGLTANIAQARDLGPDEALRLRDAGTIVSFEKLNATALTKHPGSTITETELEEEYGKYIYQIEMRDPQGLNWIWNWTRSAGKCSRIIRIRNEGYCSRHQSNCAGAVDCLLDGAGA
jgi:hypothetical protein